MERHPWTAQAVTKTSSWSKKICVADGYLNALPYDDLAELEQLIDDAERVLKHDQTTTVVQLNIPEDENSLVIKRYNPRNQWHKFKRALRLTRARRCWRMSYAFAQAGLNVARPLLMGEQRFGPVRMNAYFVNQRLAGQELLQQLPMMSIEEQRRVAIAVAEAFQKMRDARITHGDMKASNLIWLNGALFFIDLDAAQQHRYYMTWAKSHKKDHKRFMKNWQNTPHLLELFDAI